MSKLSDRKMCNACYKCKHVGSVPGSAHNRCNHPSIKTDPLGEIFGILGSVGRAVPPALPLESAIKAVGDPHGVKNGWFLWPFNFDPAWLIECDGFDEKPQCLCKKDMTVPVINADCPVHGSRYK